MRRGVGLMPTAPCSRVSGCNVPPKLTQGTLTPPRGRAYATVDAAQRDFDAGKRFYMQHVCRGVLVVVTKDDFSAGADLRVKVARGTVTGRLEVR